SRRPYALTASTAATRAAPAPRSTTRASGAPAVEPASAGDYAVRMTQPHRAEPERPPSDRIAPPPVEVLSLPDDPATREERYRTLAAEIAMWAEDPDEFPFELAMLDAP